MNWIIGYGFLEKKVFWTFSENQQEELKNCIDDNKVNAYCFISHKDDGQIRVDSDFIFTQSTAKKIKRKCAKIIVTTLHNYNIFITNKASEKKDDALQTPKE